MSTPPADIPADRPADEPAEVSVPSPEGARPSRLRWAPLLVIAVAWIAHESARHNGWVLDDAALVRDSREVARGPAAIAGILVGGWKPSETASGSYGPVAAASFAVEAPLWRDAAGGLAPGGFHLTNLLLHGLCAVLLLRVLLVLMPRRPILALVAAVVFAAHPLHAGTVGPLMGRGELLATLFSLLATLAWRAYGGRHASWLPLTALCWLLAILSKEIAIGLPLVFLVLDRALPPADADASPVKRAVAYLVFAVPLAIFATTWGGPGVSMTDLPVQGVGARLLIGLQGWARALIALIVPVGLRGDHTDEALPATGYPIEGLALVVALGMALLSVLVLLRAWRGRAGAWDVVWLAMLALVVPAALIARTGAPLETRFAYLVAMPAFAGAGMLIESLALRSGRVESFTLVRACLVSGVIAACFIGLSHREARAWRDDETFHTRLLDRNPQHVRAMVRLASAQRRAADELRLASARLRADAPRREQLLAQREDAVKEALAWSRRAVRHELGRNNADAWRELGLAELANDRGANALRALERARALDPALQASRDEIGTRFPPARLRSAAEVYFAIGKAQEVLGQREAAADAYQTASKLAPDRLDYLEQAGMVLCRVSRYAEGLTLLHEGLRRTSEREARKRLETAIDNARQSARRIAKQMLRDGRAAEAKGETGYREAVSLFERATEVNPALVEAHIRAGWLRGWWFGNYEVSDARFDYAQKLLEDAVRSRKLDKDDPRFAQIESYRRELAKQRAQEAQEDDGDERVGQDDR